MPYLDWVNKNQAKESTHNIPVRLLQQEAAYGDSSGAHSDNLIIQGDNLLALKALMPVYAGRIKCIFIDPPYNTMSAFEHYDDRLEHSHWLSMMYPRLVLLRLVLALACMQIFRIPGVLIPMSWKREAPRHRARLVTAYSRYRQGHHHQFVIEYSAIILEPVEDCVYANS